MTVISNRMIELRKNKKLSQEDIAHILDITPTAYGHYERGRTIPPVSVIKQLSNYYDVTTDYLLGNSNNPKLNRRDELNIQKDLEKMREDYENGTLRLNLDGEEVDDEIKKFILENMENVLILAKIKAKEKFTPKKYRKK